MRHKKLLCVLVALGLIATLFAGCRNGSGGTVNENTAVAKTEAASTTEQTKEEPPVRLVYERPYWGDLGFDSPGIERMSKIIKKKLNIELVGVGQANPSDQQEKFNLMIAAGEQVDFAYMPYLTASGVINLRRFADDGTIIPVDDLLQKYAPDLMKVTDPTVWPFFKYKGQTWAAGCYEYVPSATCFFVRKDWLQKDGLQAPTTIEEYEKVMLTFKDKQKSQGFVQFWGGMTESLFVGSFVPTGAANFIDTDGKIKSYQFAPGFKDYLATMQKWYKEGVLHKEILTMKYQQTNDLLISGKVGSGHAWLDASTWIIEGSKIDPNYDLEILKPFKGAVTGSYPQQNTVSDMVVITKMCKRPDKVMELLNYTGGTSEGYMLVYFGENGVDGQYDLQPDGTYKVSSTFKPSLKPEELYNSYFRTIEPIKFQFKLHFPDKITDPKSQRDWYSIVNAPEMNVIKGADFGLYYDVGAMKTKDLQQSLTPVLEEAKSKIIMGQKPVGYWDDAVKEYLSKGGQQVIDEFDQQFKDWKAAQGK